MGNPRTTIVLVCLAILVSAGCSDRLDVDRTAPGEPGTPSTAPGPTGPDTLASGEATDTSALFRRQPDEYIDFVPPKRSPCELTLVCPEVTVPPKVDGVADDAAWNQATPVVTLDFSSQREITLRAVHTATHIYFLVQIPDAAPSETHRSWVWDASDGIYKPGPDREDMFVLKWSLVGNDVDLSFRNPMPHRADVWFWKARRTNPSGYWDDKHHALSPVRTENALEIKRANGRPLYLRRTGDDGRSAYDERIPFEYEGAVVSKYIPRRPEGSRADVRGNGCWQNGKWTLELERKLDTGHDDIVFEVGGRYLFAACCYEMSATGMDSRWNQPLYRTGDAFDRLILVVK